MLSGMLALLLNSAFLMLRLGGSGGSFPRPLSAEEERKYLSLAAEGDEEARAVLIEHNLRLVAHIVKKYYSTTCDQDDLISIGTVGLIKGITSYRPDRASGWLPTLPAAWKTRYSCISAVSENPPEIFLSRRPWTTTAKAVSPCRMCCMRKRISWNVWL